MDYLAKLQHFGSRFFGLIILPAQLPGDPLEVVLDLKDDPVGTIKGWDWSVVKQLTRQIFTSQKITIPDDPLLERLHKSRSKYLSKGWSACPLHTSDGIMLDGYIKPPVDGVDVAPRYIIFVGGNSQKYEDWLPYFDLYARDSGLGFLCFNNRGVARSEGCVTCLDDMLLDLRAAYSHLVDTLGVRTEHILFHGFSIGAAVSAAFLSQPGAPKCAITSDRSFRSFCHAAFAIVRGPDAAVGKGAPAASAFPSGGLSLSTHGVRAVAAATLRSTLLAALALLRVVVAQIGVLCFRATGWELNALEAWPRIQGPKVLLYNSEDNIVNYTAASLHYGLLHAADSTSSEGGDMRSTREALEQTTVVEVTIRQAQGWALHDCPLSLDTDAWVAMIRAERAALGLGMASVS